VGGAELRLSISADGTQKGLNSRRPSNGERSHNGQALLGWGVEAKGEGKGRVNAYALWCEKTGLKAA